MERWIEHPIVPSGRPKTLYEYVVTGIGDFPYDMLRHDACWPVSGVDADRMFHRDGERRSIKMRSYTEPTVQRWWSFGWSVGGRWVE